MASRKRTAEWVSPNHPDKVCDFISDSILDACLEQDKHSRVAVETMAGHGKVHLTGEITTTAELDYDKIVVEALQRLNIDTTEVEVTANIVQQSPDIARGVDTGGAGDQGIMVGYANIQNKTLMPLEYEIARELGYKIWEATGKKLDIKTQVTTIDGCGYGSVDTVLVSAEQLTSDEIKAFIDEFLPEQGIGHNIRIIANPCGEWIGGFNTDAGVTGRKIVVDQYGPNVPVGGGAFSGKDPSKVDRSAAYMARKVANEICVKEGYDWVLVKVAYAIGLNVPLSLEIETERGEYTDTYQFMSRFEPNNIIEELGLRDIKYADLIITGGTFGVSGRPWEKHS